jgi:hypothetical protein
MSPSTADPMKPRFTWFSFVMSSGREKAGSTRCGNPLTRRPFASQA